MRYSKSYNGFTVTVLRHKTDKSLFFKHFDALASKDYTLLFKLEHKPDALVITTDNATDAWIEKVWHDYVNGQKVLTSHHFGMKERYPKLDDFEVVFVELHSETIVTVPD